MIIRFLYMSFIFMSFFLLGFSCEIMDSVSKFHRTSSIVRGAWNSCNYFVKPKCMTIKTDFCQEKICHLSFEDWEDMKPTTGCNPSNTSIHKICKILFNESCNAALKLVSCSWKYNLLLFTTVILSSFYSNN